MIYLNIWNDIHPIVSKHGNDYMLNKLIDLNKSDDIGVMCAEEASMHDIRPFLLTDTMSKFNRLYMVQGGYDKSYYSFLDSFKNLKFEIWPYYFLYESVYHNNSANNKQQIDRLFLCMNYKPRIHRKKLLDRLAKFNLLDYNYYTWHQPKESKFYKPDLFDEDQYEWKYWKPKQVYLEGQTWDQYAPPIQMSKCVINLVTESFLHCPFITEKTWNSIISKKPFIILGNVGIHRHLETLGFKLPTQINYSFDSVADNDLRITMIVDEINRLSKKNLQELSESMQDVVEHNYMKAIDIVKTEKQSKHVYIHYNKIIDRAKDKANGI
ncbi:MAG: hypothetical protein CMG35_12175 [Candidatus Marinimicrobia bacterium]|nr:hypothetical protein [Candidatus Neomarinimicrobiota bacterium]